VIVGEGDLGPVNVASTVMHCNDYRGKRRTCLLYVCVHHIMLHCLIARQSKGPNCFVQTGVVCDSVLD
jgi:hypothetical protein